MRFIFTATAVATVALLSTGCFIAPFLGCDEGAPIVDSEPVTLTPSVVTVQNVCPDPSQTGADIVLSVRGSDPKTAPIFVVTVGSEAEIGIPTPLTVIDSGSIASAAGIQFVYTPNIADVDDATSISSVRLTVDPLPTHDGDHFAVTFEVHFLDGRVLDQVFAADLAGETTCRLQ